jgi:hypothetical protein
MKLAGTAYQVIAALAGAAGQLEHPEVQRALAFFNGGFQGGESLLPWDIEPPKKRNERSGKKVVAIATRAMKGEALTEAEIKSLAGSVLTQARDRKK